MNWNQILDKVIKDPVKHAKFLNTLSMMENTGARKISACEDKNKVTLAILKHAAEEHRHAFYLKKQIAKLGEDLCPSYYPEHLLAPIESKFYLDYLDVKVSRYLKDKHGLAGQSLKFTAYLMVTYAIEVRAEELYPAYQIALDKAGINITVKSIIVEEVGHLEEMRKQLGIRWGDNWQEEAREAVKIETHLFENWIQALA